MMYEFSRDYLSRLLSDSGVKSGTAKHAAMIEIIELLDENTLGGLIDAIRADYEKMQTELKRREELARSCGELKEQRERIIKQIEALAEQKVEIEESISELLDCKKEKEFLASLHDLCEQEKSRVMAYRAALQLGMKMLPEFPRDNNMIAQVIRSASNVAANWKHSDCKEENK